MEKQKSLQTVTQCLENMFAPDITFHWDDGFKCHVMKPVTELGHAFVKRVRGITTSIGFVVAGSLMEEVYESALKCGLTVERIDRE